MSSNIAVKITADTAQLTAQLAVASAQSRAFTTEMNNLAKQAIAAGGATPELTGQLQQVAAQSIAAKAKMADLRAELKGGSSSFALLGSAVGELRGGLAALGVGLTAGGITEFVSSMSEMGELAVVASKELGTSTDVITKLGYAAGVSGVDAQSAVTAWERLEKNMVDAQKGTGEAREAFAAVGISAEDLKNKYQSFDSILPAIADKFAQTADGPNKTAVAMALMGRAGAEMIPILDQGSGGLAALGEQAAAAGVVLKGPAAEGMAKTHEAVYALGQDTKGILISAFKGLEPEIDQVVTGLGKQAEQFLKNAQQSVVLHGALTVIEGGFDALIDIVAVAGSIAEQTWDGMEGGAIASAHAIETLGEVSRDALGGNFSKASADFHSGLSTIEADIGKTVARVKAARQDLRDFLDQTGKAPVSAPDADNKPNLPGLVDPALAQKAAEQARQIADAQAQAFEQGNLKHIESEAQTNSALLQMGQESLGQWKAQADALEDARWETEEAYYGKKQVLDAGNKVALAKDIAAEEQLWQEHSDRLIGIDQKYQEEKRKDDDGELAQFIANAQAKLESDRKALEDQYKNHQITAQQLHDQENALTQAVETEILKRLQAQIDGLTLGTDAYRAAVKQRDDLEKQFSKDFQATNNALIDEQMAKWKTLASSMESSINSALNNMIIHGSSFQTFMTSVADAVAESFLQMGEKWIEQQAEDAIFGPTLSANSARAQIGQSAAVAGANAFAATAAIPIVGPELAPGAGAAAYSAAMAYEGLVSLDIGTNYVPANMLAMIHEGEAVVPKAYNPAAGAGADGGFGGGGGDSYTININAVDAQSVQRLFAQNGSALVNAMAAQKRGGNSFFKGART